MSCNLFLLAFVLGIGGTFQYGLQISIINSPAEYIKSFIHETWLKRYGSSPSEEIITLMWSFIVSIYSIGGLLGSLFAGYLLVRFGRKKAMLLTNIPALLSAALMGLSRLSGSFEMIIIGRMFSGVCGAVKQLWGDGDHAAEMDDMMAEQKAINGEKAKSVCDLFRDKAVRWQLITLFLVSSCMQLIGINVVYFYAYSVFVKAGIPPAQTCYVSLGVGITEILTTVLCGFLIERAGRKMLLWKSYTVMSLALGLLTVTLSLQDSFFWVPYCSVALIFIFIMSFGIGPAGVICPLPTEIFIQSYRPAAYVLSGVTNWIQLFLLGLVFPFIAEGLGSFCFIIFFAYCLSMAIFVFLVMPETKGKTMLQIMEEFNRLNYRGKKRQTVLWQNDSSVTIATRL
ncbi:solute carrier family 2, facilitated glucose transporter member 11-like isoform X3 [Dromaius novaehollandiae]|uniref:solute carrier family 2, facilitated glucose transporter member 11-like isoform X3 n=1 Tax=Dromaius novaehollandiae TaxID=8790 RepID=UPI000E1EE1A7|nr:solute carrier family 2, facilitated glucose transporter member 11-like isoform X3 [Dromaius novaehollandiae]